MKNGLVFWACLVLIGCGDATPSMDVLRENRQGLADLKAERWSSAGDHFAQGMAQGPFQPELHLNLGLSFEMQGQAESAQKSYEMAEKIAPPGLVQFAARHNLGQLAGKAKKVDQALEWYQKALELKPDSVEVKTNIELLIQQQQQDQKQQQKQDQSDNKDQKDDQKDDQQKDPNKDQGKDPKDQKDQGKDQQPKDDQGKDPKDQKKDKKSYGSSPKYKPREFKGDLSESDVKKILGEIRQQEQKIRAEFNRKETKERPRDKDW